MLSEDMGQMDSRFRGDDPVLQILRIVSTACSAAFLFLAAFGSCSAVTINSARWCANPFARVSRLSSSLSSETRSLPSSKMSFVVFDGAVFPEDEAMERAGISNSAGARQQQRNPELG